MLVKPSWDTRMLLHAAFISTFSKDPSTKVGAVIADAQHRVVSQGYNGFPQGIQDDHRLDNREEKYPIVLHAEENAVIFAQRSLNNCTLYSFPIMPCSTCAAKLIQAGISQVVAPAVWPAHWLQSLTRATHLFQEAHVLVQLISKSDILSALKQQNDKMTLLTQNFYRT